MGSESVRGIDRRRLLRWGGLGAAGAVAAGAPLAGTRSGPAAAAGQDRPDSADLDVPADARPGGAYDRYVAELAAAGRFSGVVMLSHQGRTVLSRSYGMADREKGIRNHEDIAFSLSSAGKPFEAVAILQLAQQGKLWLSDTVGTYLTGFAKDIADQVNIHHLLSGTSGLDSPGEDVQRVFQSRDDVHQYYEQRARQAKPAGVPGTPDTAHAEAEVTVSALIVEAVTGKTYWDYVQENILARCGMTGSAFCTRPQWLTDEHIAHPYMTLADGSQVDATPSATSTRAARPRTNRARTRAAPSSMPPVTAATPPRRIWSVSRTRWATARSWTGPGPTCSPGPRSPTGRRRSGRTGSRSPSSTASGGTSAPEATPVSPRTGPATRTPAGSASSSATSTACRCRR
ncbi:serine hydrolase [Kitasatospora sp. NPDC006697]|uniref:serine hydrolase domain-containing protein n=1 Tax=Kitasatospora sp. NPDC006697 TaxID=3364020 RepID=UPI0036C08F0F